MVFLTVFTIFYDNNFNNFSTIFKIFLTVFKIFKIVFMVEIFNIFYKIWTTSTTFLAVFFTEFRFLICDSNFNINLLFLKILPLLHSSTLLRHLEIASKWFRGEKAMKFCNIINKSVMIMKIFQVSSSVFVFNWRLNDVTGWSFFDL